MNPQIVISASRRTDVPAFYMDWFMDRIEKGFFETVNPYNRKKSIVPATTDDVHTIVFWSKDFSKFIETGAGEALREKGYHLFFNFTVNSETPFLEPNIPTRQTRLKQVRILCKTFGPETVTWRFDPICFFTHPDGSEANNLGDFKKIAGHMESIGILRCVTSFMDHYAKIAKRPKPYPGFRFLDPEISQKVRIIEKMASVVASTGMKLYTCCEKDVQALIPPELGVENSSCIPNRLLVELFGGHLSFRKDAGQRVKQGCGCLTSTDIGVYDQHPCFHNCLFCYANPKNRTLK